MKPQSFLSRATRDHALLGKQVLRFLFTGVINTFFGYAVYLIGLLFDLLPEVALAIATVVGAVFNYFTTSRLVFKHSKADRFPRFLLGYVVIYLVNAAFLRTLIYSGVDPSWAQLIALPLIAAFSFVIFRLFVFPMEPRDVSKAD